MSSQPAAQSAAQSIQATAARPRANLNNRPILAQAIQDLPSAQLNTSFAPAHGTWEGESCSICLEEYQTGELIKVVPCGHFGHVDCLTPMIVEISPAKCAECRASIFTAEQHEQILHERLSSIGDSGLRIMGVIQLLDLDFNLLHFFGEERVNFEPFRNDLRAVLSEFRVWLDEVYNPAYHSINAVQEYILGRQIRQVYDQARAFYDAINENFDRQHSLRGVHRPPFPSWESLINPRGSLLPAWSLRPAQIFDAVRGTNPDPYSVILHPWEVFRFLTERLHALAPTFVGMVRASPWDIGNIDEFLYRMGDLTTGFADLVRRAHGRQDALIFAQRRLEGDIESIYNELHEFFTIVEGLFAWRRDPIDFPLSFLNFLTRNREESQHGPFNLQPNWADTVARNVRSFRRTYPRCVRPAGSRAIPRESLVTRLRGRVRWASLRRR